MSELQNLASTNLLTQDKIKLLKSTIMPKGASNDELELFINIINKTQLDPFSRQIYAIRRNKDIKFEVSIDGARLIAQRSGQYAGQLGPFWCGKDGQWVDVWTKSEPPFASKVGVLRSNFKEPLYAVAITQEYRPQGNQAFMWNKMPALMIAKVAEMLALRKGFPQELSGLYSQEEMQQSDDNKTNTKIDTDNNIKNEAIEVKRVDANARERGIKATKDLIVKLADSDKERFSFILHYFELNKLTELDAKELKDIIKIYNELKTLKTSDIDIMIKEQNEINERVSEVSERDQDRIEQSGLFPAFPC